MMSEPVTDGWVGDAHAAALLYLNQGFSVLPLQPRRKEVDEALLPIDPETNRPTWRPYMTKAPSGATVARWFRKSPRAGVGIIGGAVSGGLAMLDFDDLPFVVWFREHMLPVLDTWIVETGNVARKLHVYVYSNAPAGSKLGDAGIATIRGERVVLGDLRGDGGYVVAPPSLHPDTGEPYRTLSGSPDALLRVGSAVALYRSLKDAYERARSVTIIDLAHPTPGPAASDGPDMLPPASAEEQERLKRLLVEKGVPSYAQRAVTRGGDPDNHWQVGTGDQLDHSRLDFGVAASLCEYGVGWDDMEAMMASFPWGAFTYQNRRRKGSYGRAYFRHLKENVTGRLVVQAESAQKAGGRNYEVTRVVRLEADEPQYHVTLRRTDIPNDPERTATFRIDQLQTERLFREGVIRYCNFSPLPDIYWQTKGRWPEYAGKLVDMATVEAAPDSTTTSGNLRQDILSLLRQNVLGRSAPDELGANTWGWESADGREVLVLAYTLIRTLQRQRREPTSAESVWDALRPLNARHDRIHLGGQRVHVWILPSSALA